MEKKEAFLEKNDFVSCNLLRDSNTLRIEIVSLLAVDEVRGHLEYKVFIRRCTSIYLHDTCVMFGS